MRHLLRACATGLLLASLPVPAGSGPGETSLTPQLSIVVLERAVLAVAPDRGGQREARLELGERVRWNESRGRVGVVLTDRRVLAVASRSGAWQETRYRQQESTPGEAILGDRVALVITDKRVIGFDGGTGNLIEASLGVRERVTRWAVGENVLVVTTNRRALGLSPFRGGFFETTLRLEERLESITADSTQAIVRTSQRLLIFRGPFGSWEERRLPLR